MHLPIDTTLTRMRSCWEWEWSLMYCPLSKGTLIYCLLGGVAAAEGGCRAAQGSMQPRWSVLTGRTAWLRSSWPQPAGWAPLAAQPLAALLKRVLCPQTPRAFPAYRPRVWHPQGAQPGADGRAAAHQAEAAAGGSRCSPAIPAQLVQLQWLRHPLGQVSSSSAPS